jgi:hypothetical protein
VWLSSENSFISAFSYDLNHGEIRGETSAPVITREDFSVAEGGERDMPEHPTKVEIKVNAIILINDRCDLSIANTLELFRWVLSSTGKQFSWKRDNSPGLIYSGDH